MKKILLCIITLTLLLCFVACETSSEDTSTNRTYSKAETTTTLTDSTAFSLFANYMKDNMSELTSKAQRYDRKIHYVDHVDIGSFSVDENFVSKTRKNRYRITANGNFYGVDIYGNYTGRYNFTWTIDITYSSPYDWRKNDWSFSGIQISD